MPDRKKIIKGLDEVWEYISKNVKDIASRKSRMMDMVADACNLLKEQEAFEWINVKDKLPGKDGQYLVVYTFFDYRSMGVVRFSHNLHEIDEYIFDTENRPGWYEPDDEVGYFERTTVTHWAKLPEFPKEGR